MEDVKVTVTKSGRKTVITLEETDAMLSKEQCTENAKLFATTMVDSMPFHLFATVVIGLLAALGQASPPRLRVILEGLTEIFPGTDNTSTDPSIN